MNGPLLMGKGTEITYVIDWWKKRRNGAIDVQLKECFVYVQRINSFNKACFCLKWFETIETRSSMKGHLST